MVSRNTAPLFPGLRCERENRGTGILRQHCCAAEKGHRFFQGCNFKAGTQTQGFKKALLRSREGAPLSSGLQFQSKYTGTGISDSIAADQRRGTAFFRASISKRVHRHRDLRQHCCRSEKGHRFLQAAISKQVHRHRNFRQHCCAAEKGHHFFQGCDFKAGTQTKGFKTALLQIREGASLSSGLQFLSGYTDTGF